MAKNETYEEFVNKFKPKLTTDDCYTPPRTFNAVLGWVIKEYKLTDETPILRPFWPGADYQAADYPAGCVVVDNPPSRSCRRSYGSTTRTVCATSSSPRP